MAAQAFVRMVAHHTRFVEVWRRTACPTTMKHMRPRCPPAQPFSMLPLTEINNELASVFGQVLASKKEAQALVMSELEGGSSNGVVPDDIQVEQPLPHSRS